MTDELSRIVADELIERAKAYLTLAEKATPGPWSSYEGGSCVYAGPSFLVAHCDYSDEVGPQHHLDAAFISASHEAAAIIRALRDRLAALQAPQETSLAERQRTWYVDDYGLCADGGYYTPTEQERMLLVEVVNGLMADDDFVIPIGAALRARGTPAIAALQAGAPQPVATVAVYSYLDGQSVGLNANPEQLARLKQMNGQSLYASPVAQPLIPQSAQGWQAIETAPKDGIQRL